MSWLTKKQNELRDIIDNKTQKSDRRKKKISKQKTSLTNLTSHFINLLKKSEKNILDMTTAHEKLKVSKRRIYDIVNVLEGIGYVQKC